jgi:amino acid adenylation domain-containing protein
MPEPEGVSPAARRPLAEPGLRTSTIHGLVANRIHAARAAVAIVDSAGAMTYGELDESARRIEHALAAAGVARGTTIGVCMPRTRMLIASLLAVLRRGAAYVPFDPAYPAERLRLMRSDSRAALILATAHSSRPDAFDPGVLLRVDEIANADLGSLEPAVAGARDLAYVIYTSGSTGTPKGVAIEHRSAVAFLEWARTAFTGQELGGMLASTSICFDLSVFEIFAPLAWGGTVLLAENALQLSELQARDRVRVINTVPSAMAELLRLDSVPDSVNTVCLAGEVFPLRLARLLGRCPGVRRVLNLYGPSEDTTYSTWATIDPDDDTQPPIGQPLEGTEAYVLNDASRRVSPGEKGVLYLGGEGLARGYLGRPAQTASRFVPDPWSGRPGARLYCTGDVVRECDGGVLEFLGRLDDQVKVRGHRVELGEVTAALRSAPHVADAAVVLYGEFGTAGAELAAYVVEADARFSVAEARETLRRQLPQWMVPTTFTVLDALPRTLNGKVDKRRLPTPRRGSETGARRGPRTDVERSLAAIWSEVLNSDRFGITDRFFDAGGHSLSAARVATRIRQEFDVAMTIRDVFEHPTIQALAAVIETRAARGDRGGVACIPRLPDRDSVPLAAAQRPMWFLAQLQPDDTSYNIACVIDVRGNDVRAERLVLALNEVVRRHESLRTAFTAVDGIPRQTVLPYIPFDVEIVDAREGEARAHTAELARRAFDLASPPLFRARVLQTQGRSSCAIAFAAHHIVFDDWSIGVLVRDLAELDAALAETRHPALEPLQVQYADFAAWQSQNVAQEAELSWWKQQLTGAPPLLRLRTRKPQTDSRGNAGESVAITLDAADVAAARSLAASHGATLYMLLLSTFAVLMRQASGQRELVIGSAVAGRERVETEPVIGCFINLLPMRIAAGDDDLPFAELVRSVRTTVLEAFAHGSVPFAHIVDELRPPRGPYNPIAQVAFGIQNAPPPNAVTPHATWSAVELDPAEARVDLTLWLDERAGPMRALWTWNSELFERRDVEALHASFNRIVRDVSLAPETTIGALMHTALPLKENHGMTSESTQPKGRRFPGSAAPKAVRAADLMAMEPEWLGGCLPLKVQPRVGGVQLAHWAELNRELIVRELHRAGGILFRGFEVDAVDEFRAFARSVSSELIRYGERSSPRTEIGDGIYTSTDHPADQPIVLHNEQSYTTNWPMKIIFYCDRPPSRRGRTPIANSRRILARLDPELVSAFEKRGVLYVRNYLPGISVSWREAFQTEDRAAVERYCSEADLEVEWLGADHLRTRQVRAAVRTHPVTGERVWFNHALFFHVSSLPREVSASLQMAVPEKDLPYQTYYGTGEPIDSETLAALRAAFDAETVSFDWQRGDVLLLDNMLSAHGREPFEGPRRILTAMTDPVAVLHGRPVARPLGTAAETRA